MDTSYIIIYHVIALPYFIIDNMNDIRYCTSYDHVITPPFLLVDSMYSNVESQSITIALSYSTPYNNPLYLLLTVDVPMYDRNL